MVNPFFGDISGKNLGDVKLLNRAVVFRTIREAGSISRSELAKTTGLNPSTVTHIVRVLIELGLIEEVGNTESKGGRPSTLIQICSQAGYIVAVHLDRYFIRAMITNLNLGEKVQAIIHATPADSVTQINIDNLLNIIEDVIHKSGIPIERLVGIGICAPGPLDAQEGVLLSPPNFPGWPSMPIRQILHDRFHLPTFLEKDANASALAEKLFGAMRDAENFVFLLGDGGLGGGIFANGDIYRGDKGTAGEIGHTSVDMNGPKCICGNRGCIELYAPPQVVVNYVIDQLLHGGKTSDVLPVTNGEYEKISFEMIVHAAQAGDPLCLTSIDRMTKALSAGIINIINLFDPKAVVLGGEITLAKEFLRPVIEKALKTGTLSCANTTVPLYFSQMGQDVQIIGAFSLVLRELFQNPSMLQARNALR